MKNIFVAVAVVGLIATFTMAQSIRQAENPATVLAELDSTPFGSTILSLVSVHLSAQKPYDQLIVLLSEVSKKLTDEQKDDDSNHGDSERKCKDTQKRLSDEIASLIGQKNTNILDRDTNQKVLNVASADLRDTISSINLNHQRLTDGQAERDTQHNVFQKALVEREGGIHALDGAIQLVQHLKSGSSFVQLKKRFEKVEAELIETSKNSSFGHLYTPIIAALSQLAEQASPETISKILQLFNDLRSQFTKDKQQLTVAENKQMEAWTSLRADLETEKDQLLEKRRDLEEQIDILQKNIARAVKQINILTGQIRDSQAELKRTKETCESEAKAYQKRHTLRDAQVHIIKRVIGIFETRAKATVDFIKARTDKATL